jgi:hypothetical protein
MFHALDLEVLLQITVGGRVSREKGAGAGEGGSKNAQGVRGYRITYLYFPIFWAGVKLNFLPLGLSVLSKYMLVCESSWGS